jgi:hypothetical protein
MKPEFINGPTNFAYLKGNINGIEKNIYLFFDKHLDLENQTRCKSFNSIDISYYLYRLIQESKVPLDFFMEIELSQLNSDISDKKDIYIKEVINLFKSEFALKNNKNLDIEYSKTNSNVRLHYFDIRDHLDIYYLTKIINQKIIKYYGELKKEYNIKYIDKISYYLDLISSKLDIFNKNTKEVIDNKSVKYDKFNDKQKYYLNKIINQYENKDLRNYINFFISSHSGIIINSINGVIELIKNMFKSIIPLNLNILKNKIDELGEYILRLYFFYTDAYLLRRILDKNYVKNCIIYSGGYHSVNYIFFLVKHCNFRIINIYNSQEKNTNELMKKIINESYSFNLSELFLLKKVYIQCIHLIPLGIDDLFSSELKKYFKSKI